MDCQAGTAANCNAGVGCTEGSCNEGTDSCDNIANNANCDDGLFCNGAETCNATLDCQADTGRTCSRAGGLNSVGAEERHKRSDHNPRRAHYHDRLLFHRADTRITSLLHQPATAITWR